MRKVLAGAALVAALLVPLSFNSQAIGGVAIVHVDTSMWQDNDKAQAVQNVKDLGEDRLNRVHK